MKKIIILVFLISCSTQPVGTDVFGIEKIVIINADNRYEYYQSEFDIIEISPNSFSVSLLSFDFYYDTNGKCEVFYEKNPLESTCKIKYEKQKSIFIITNYCNFEIFLNSPSD